MQSIKNSAVTIILLFLSYGVYQVITQPLPSESESMSTDLLEISGPADVQPDRQPDSIQNEFLTSLNRNTAKGSFQLDRGTELGSQTHSDPIPPQLLELKDDAPATFNPPATFADAQREIENRFNRSVGSQQFASNSNSFERPPAAPPTFPVTQASSDTDAQQNADSTQFVDFQQDTTNQQSDIRQQFDSDTRIIPQTETEVVAARPETNSFSNDSTNQASTYEPTLTESWPTIRASVETGKFQDALKMLSKYYRNGNVQLHEREQLLDWLDALAAKVIYSSEHHLRTFPYIIQPGDTIGSLAREWQVPAQLIYNVNARKIPDPNQLTQGVEIKHVQGPFDAEIDPDQGIMTLYLNDLYAGRFEIRSGQAIPSGEFQIVDKSVKDAANRSFWMELNNGASIFASSQAPSDQSAIGMDLEEAEEVFSILSASSRIRVMR